MISDHHLYNTSACARADAGAPPSCVTLNIKCETGTRIQIVSAFYGYRKRRGHGNAVQIQRLPECASECSFDGKCCTYEARDRKLNVSRLDMRELKRQCSWMVKCSPRASFNEEDWNLYTTVSYYCIPGTIFFLIISIYKKEAVDSVFNAIFIIRCSV